ncbi:MAG: tetratricopeptide repeat protein [Planctomycetota bacterium]|jgi:hypothetical protein
MGRGPLFLAVILAAAGLYICGCETPQEAGPWKDFDLATTRVSNITVRYEKPLAPKIKTVTAVLQKFIADEAARQARLEQLDERRDAIVAEVCSIVGHTPTDEQRKKYAEVFSWFLRAQVYRLDVPGRKTTVYLVLRDHVEDYLRKGGQLPGLSYDAASGKGKFFFHWRQMKNDPPGELRDVSFALPVEADKPEEMLDSILKMWGESVRKGAYGLALHELAESAILQRLKPKDRYCRWFNEGFANGVAIELLAKVLGPDAAKGFAEGFDVARYAELTSKVNLRYWVNKDASIEAPIERETQLTDARYAFATHEAARLIDAHGLECLPEILAKATEGSRGDCQRLFAAIKQVTGRDMEERLLRYQTFQSREKGLYKYSAEMQIAFGRKNFEAAAFAAMRLLEIQEKPSVKAYLCCLFCLAELGHDDFVAAEFLKRITTCEKLGEEEPAKELRAGFMAFALEKGHAESAYETAEGVLKTNPDDIRALAIRMHRLRSEGKIEQAVAAARKIVGFEKYKTSPPVLQAKQLLREAAPQAPPEK